MLILSMGKTYKKFEKAPKQIRYNQSGFYDDTDELGVKFLKKERKGKFQTKYRKDGE
jgi:hypothetical protein